MGRVARWALVGMGVLLAGVLAEASAQSREAATVSAQTLARQFMTPPDAAKPRTWWHWTNGNVSEDGITKDLEWMKRSGIGGFQLADVAAGGGQTVEKKINYGTPEWYHAVRHSADEAQRLGLEMAIFSSPGWSEAGGPWVTPAQSMKKLVWSETEVTGPKKISETLPQPPSNEGPVRDLGVGGHAPPAPPFYRDSLVVAYRTPPDAGKMQAVAPRVTSSAGAIDPTALLDDSLNTAVTLPASEDGTPAWINYEFPQPYTARALTIGGHPGIPVGRLMASDDSVTFRAVVAMPGPEGYHGAPVRTFAFPAVTARYFRVELQGAPLLPAAVIHGEVAVPAKRYTISELRLSSEARVSRWEDKGAFGSLMDRYDVVPTPEAPTSAEIGRMDVIDLTDRMSADGTLHWDVPAGSWTILRMGYSPTGAKNRPATAAGSGYEVDKLNADYVQGYLEEYMRPIQQSLGNLVGRTLQYMLIDSWEAGMQNWTDNMPAEFERRRGYSLLPYMPVLAGHVVGSAEISDRFLWDFRRTLADMYADEFYTTVEAGLRSRGMQSYSEASGVALEIPEDTLLNKSKVDIPMGEFWTHSLHPDSMYDVDVRGAVSAAHIYGKPIVAAEAFTGGRYESPYTLKKLADVGFAKGLNRLVFHTSAQQPTDEKPGNTMVGAHLNRNITWAEQAQPFMQYVARVSYMLQQGRAVVDLAYLLPQGAPSTMPFWGAGLQPAPPAGYSYDYLDTEILLRLKVEADGRLALPSGMHYHLLILPPTEQMTPEVAAKLHDLVAGGATVLGQRPKSSPSLMHFPQADGEVEMLAADLWGDTDGVTNTQHRFGRGMTYTGLPVEEVLKRIGVPRDFVAAGSLESPPVWTHRRVGATDLYFVASQSDTPEDLRIHLRVRGRAAQIWRPMDGTEEQASYSRSNGDLTTVPLQLQPRESVFVIFPEAATEEARALPSRPLATLATLKGPWELSFPAGWGAPASVELPAFQSWTESVDPGVKYFSGSGTYARDFEANPVWLRPGARLLLDLGDVRDVAEVTVNGRSAGVVWAPPYRVDVSGLLRPGKNRLLIKVTNEWTNRQLGDVELPRERRVLNSAGPDGPHSTAFTNAYGVPDTLAPSGLLSPPRLLLEAGPLRTAGTRSSVAAPGLVR